ncbi:FtsX-like permease family protein [Anaeroplasma bactoclasticum]|jgi:putative ABC transport system permease protein|nr:ABC transporter permease [Anaeroplasma bactoclasticum]
MKNPLFKRLPREFKKDIIKYIVMFLFLTLPIALCSGYMIGNDSMIKTYYEGIEYYNLEDGHFITENELDLNLITSIEKENEITIHKIYYKDLLTNLEHTIRLYKIEDRENINKWCVHKGNLPTLDNEIALDRLYCENNKINIGDNINISNKDYKVTAYISLFDYSSLFKNNTDSMFDANKFSISLVNEAAFNNISNDNLVYEYAYLYPNRLNDKEAHDKTIELSKNIYTKLLLNGNKLDSLLAKEDNHAITFTIDDLEGDLTMMLIFGAIIVIGLAFVFALSIKSQIEAEAKSIGTLKAMGYKNGELLVQYLILPTFVTLLAGVFGNILAYTGLKNYIVSLYYHSYSLPLYTTFYNPKALIYTTILPILMVLLINFLVILKVLLIPSLNLLRNQLIVKKNKRIVKLNHRIRFIPKFQIRVVLQNKGTYLALFFGTLLASIILLFGLMMDPLLEHYKGEVIESQIAPYQTILKVDIDNLDGEKLYVKTIDYANDQIMIFGLEKYGNNSKYLNSLNISNNKVVISKDLKSKYGFKNGSAIELEEKYTDNKYSLTVEGVYDTTGTLVIFMDSAYFKETFNDYAVSYFSDNKLDISDEFIYKVISLDDLIVVSNQLADSMGRVFILFTVISIILFALLIFLLAKIVIEKNQNQISMLKIIGYKTFDINKIYNVSTGIVTMISLIISTFIAQFFIKIAWDIVLKTKMSGWLDFYIAPYLYPIIFGLGVGSFLIVYLIESKKISKINLALALKDSAL